MNGYEERKCAQEQYINDFAAKNENAERWFKPRGLLAALCSHYDLLQVEAALNIIDVVDHMTQTELKPSSWTRDHESLFHLIDSKGGPLEVAAMARNLDRIDLGKNKMAVDDGVYNRIFTHKLFYSNKSISCFERRPHFIHTRF